MYLVFFIWACLSVKAWVRSQETSDTSRSPLRNGPMSFIENLLPNTEATENIKLETTSSLANETQAAESIAILGPVIRLDDFREVPSPETVLVVDSFIRPILNLSVSPGDVKLNVTSSQLECFAAHRYCTHFNNVPETCSCEENCVSFGNCCWDASVSQVRETVHTCSEVPTSGGGTSYSMVTKCPSYWPIKDVRDKCEKAIARDRDDLLSWVPVSNDETNTTYKNIYCASCHRDRNISAWRVDLHCPQHNEYNMSMINMSLCEKWAVIPTMVVPPLTCASVDTCDHYWMFWGPGSKNKTLAEEYQRKCSLYRAPVQFTQHFVERIYKNKFCAFCNNVKASDLYCYVPFVKSVYQGNTYASPAEVASFSLLMDIDFTQGDGVGRSCKSGHVYNPIKNVCISVWCGEELLYNEGVCVQKPGDSDHVFDSVNFRQNCTPRKTVLSFDEQNGSDYDQMYSNDSNLTDLCPEEQGDQMELKFNDVQGLLTLVCTGISLTCLLIKMALYILERSERAKTAPRAIFYLSGTLFVAQLFFLAGAPRSEWGAGCVAVALVTHYAFLSSFHWTNVLAFDIWRTFSVLVPPTSYSSRHKANKQFLRYALYSWLSPLLIVGTACIFEWALPFDDWRPMYGSGMCWINRRRALAAFFAAPLACLLLFNFVFFVCTACQICRAVKASKLARESSRQDCIRFGLYIKLALIMGLTWGIGFVAPFSKSETLWYVFIVLNGLQGAFILLAFTQFSRMWRALRQMIGPGTLTTSSSGGPGTLQDSKTSSTRATRSSLQLALASNVTSNV